MLIEISPRVARALLHRMAVSADEVDSDALDDMATFILGSDYEPDDWAELCRELSPAYRAIIDCAARQES